MQIFCLFPRWGCGVTGPDERVQIKRELYQYVVNQVQHRSERFNKEIAKYKQRYDSVNHRTWKFSNKDQLFESIQKANVVFLGDFHSLQQSQRSHLRILKNCGTHPGAVAVECIARQHQKYLDSYLFGDLAEDDFLKKVNWKKMWGFPWEHYREIFEWCRAEKISMIALNDVKSKAWKNSMKKRDLLAYDLISNWIKRVKKPIFVIYGETHLTSKYLTDSFSLSNQSSIKIFQNIDEIYFELMDLNKEDDVDVVRFNRNEYCLLNVPPWVKWQSHLMYLENKYDAEFNDEELIDFTDYIDRYIKLISVELGIKVNTHNLSVYSSIDLSFVKKMEVELTKDQFNFYKLMIEEEKAFYIPKLGIGYLGRPSINQGASLAMQYIYFETNKIKNIELKLPKHFLSLIWLEAISYFGSKIINPKRKTETINDIKSKILESDAKEIQKEPLKLALYQKTREIMILTGRPLLKNKMEIRKISSYLRSSNLLGSLLGEKIYKGYRAGLLSTRVIKPLILKKIDSVHFDVFYYECLEMIENLPESFKSKIEKL